MSFVGLFIVQVAKVFQVVLNAYLWIIIISAVLSWVRPDPYNPIVQFLHQVTEPVYRLVRRLLPRSMQSTGIDISPMIVILAILFIDTVFITMLMKLGQNLQMGGGALPIPANGELPRIP